MQVKLTDEELAAGIAMQDPLLFAGYFWRDDLTIPEEREDLGELAGSQVISKQQKLMYLDESDHILFCTGRKLAKSLCIESKIIQWAIMNKRTTEEGMGNDEALVFAPAEGHLGQIQDRVWSRINTISIFKKMVNSARRGNKPVLDWCTGLTVYFRIEGMSGTDTNMAGIRAKWVLGDELAFGDFINHNSRVQTALPGARWLYAGVPNGVRTSPFYALDQTSLGATWSRHKYPTWINPLYWSDKAYQGLLDSYPSKSDPGWITQVLGKWAEMMISSFPPSAIALHNDMYFTMDLNANQARRMVEKNEMRDSINIPNVICRRFAIGHDYGFSPDPAVSVIAIQRDDEDVAKNIWRYYARITFRNVPHPHQSEILIFIINNLFPMGEFHGFGTDDRRMVHDLHDRAPHLKNRIFWTYFGGDITETDEQGKPKLNEDGKVIKKGRKQHWTEILKDSMAFFNSNLPPSPHYFLLGHDDTVINELVSTTETRTGGGYTKYYGPPDPSGGRRILDHNTDALRCMTATIIEGEALNATSTTESQLLAALGWAGRGGEGWRPPWEHQSSRW